MPHLDHIIFGTFTSVLNMWSVFISSLPEVFIKILDTRVNNYGFAELLKMRRKRNSYVAHV